MALGLLMLARPNLLCLFEKVEQGHTDLGLCVCVCMYVRGSVTKKK